MEGGRTVCNDEGAVGTLQALGVGRWPVQVALDELYAEGCEAPRSLAVGVAREAPHLPLAGVLEQSTRNGRALVACCQLLR